MKTYFIFHLSALLFLSSGLVNAQEIGQEIIDFKTTKPTVGQVIRQIEKSGYTVSHGNNINLEQLVSFSKSKLSLSKALKELSKTTEIDHRLNGTKLILYPTKKAGSKGKTTVSGYVYDKASGESLIGATIFNETAKSGTVTNSFGFYSLSAKLPSFKIRISYVGYLDTIIDIDATQELNIKLALADQELGEVEIVESRYQETQMSTVTLSSEEIKKLPNFLGEPDALKALTLMPGVSSGNDNSGGFYVRGGGPDQNLLLLDGANIYNSSHAFDLFSTFNADAIKNIDLIKGGFPARYGGRLSSVIDVRLRDGNNDHLTWEIGLGYLLTSATVEGPLIKDKASFLVSGRRTFIDAFSPLINNASNDGPDDEFAQKIAFSDISAKVHYKISPKDHFFLSGYNSGDLFGVKESSTNKEDPNAIFYDDIEVSLGWANRVLSGRWNHQFSDKLFLNTTATYSNFDIGISIDYKEGATINGETFESGYFNEFTSKIRDYGLQAQFDFFPNAKHTMKFGAMSTYHRFTPGATVYQLSSTATEGIDTLFGNRQLASIESNLFFEDEIKFTPRLKANLGVHMASLLVEDEFYPSIQPRISTSYAVSNHWRLKASYAEMSQFIHLLTNSTIGIPLDLWVPATADAPPMRSRQVALGSSWTGGKKRYEFSLESYYKTMTNLITYKEGVRFTDVQTPWEEKIITNGDGEAYGLEVFLKKSGGKTTGWLGYTLSYTHRQFEEINDGALYPYKYDRRHDASVVLMHEFNDKISISSSWIYATGNAVTFPRGSYLGINTLPELSDATYTHSTFKSLEYDGKNSIRFPSYHRMDVGINFIKKKKRGVRTWNLSVYNTYMRKNPFIIFLLSDGKYQSSYASLVEGENPQLWQISAFWIVPSITYNFKFN